MSTPRNTRRGRPPAIPPEDVAKLRAARKNGKSIKEVAEELGYVYGTALKAARGAGCYAD